MLAIRMKVVRNPIVVNLRTTYQNQRGEVRLWSPQQDEKSEI